MSWRTRRDESGGGDGEGVVCQRAGLDRRVLAGSQLSVCRSDLSLWQSAAQAAAYERAHQAAASRSLGDDAGPELYLRSPEPGDQEARSRYDLYYRPRTWWSWPGRERLPRRNLQRGLSQRFSR